MAKSAKTILKYGCTWPAGWSQLEIEFYAIRNGGKWEKQGQTLGEGLLVHFLAARALIWPHRYRHRWTDLIYEQVLKNQICILMGCASSGKSGSMSEIGLIAYWASPQNTVVLVSSTTREKLEGAIFAEIKMLWLEGTLRYPWLAGNPIEYKMMITTDSLEDVAVRDFRRGLVCKPCYAGKNNYVGLGVYAGIKQENFWFLADELAFMAPTFLDCLPNMRSNKNLKVIGSGNPDHNTESPLGIVGEPLEGWSSVEDNEKTSVWPIRLSGGVCVNLIGTDSPNFDQDEDVYPRLVGHVFEETLRKDYGRNSPKYETQIKGRMKLSLAHSRVITRQLCRQHLAHDSVVWKGISRTKIYAVDPAYGGGDRCVAMWGEFGQDDSGKVILRLNPPDIIRINLKLPESPEDQIADTMKAQMRELGIPGANAFYDSFGKGTVGFALSRKFGHECPVPINAGEQPTKRPVRADLYVTDESTQAKRLKRCDEHYSKFITEMWFSVRYAIEASQIRELPEEVMLEGCWREYYDVAGGKIEVESKDEMRKRIGKSPDLMDCCAVLLEGARRHGFTIGGLGEEHDRDSDGENWFDIEAAKYEKLIKSKLIQHR